MSDPTGKNAETGADTAEASSVSSPLPSVKSAAAAVGQLDTSAQVEEKHEPLCLEYATTNSVPLHVQHMLQQLNGKVSDPELLLLLVYVVALESGFVEDQTYVEHQHLLKPVPAVGCFHIYNVRLLSQLPMHFTREFEDTAFRMPLHTMLDANNAQDASQMLILKSRLMAVVLGDLLMITLSPVPPSKEPGYSLCLSIGRYVLNMKLEPVYKRFRQLDELALQLRQKLFQPMRAQQLLAINLHLLHPSLLGLPSEVYPRIFRHLSKNQLKIVANVNWQLYELIQQFKDYLTGGNKMIAIDPYNLYGTI